MSATEKPVKVDYVAFGAYDSMVAEVGAFDFMAALRRRRDEFGEKFNSNDYRYAVMAVGDAQFDTEFFRTIKDARAVALETAKHYGVNVLHV